jgi:hypothetical protein
MQRLIPNNFTASYTHAYPSLKSSFPVPILLQLLKVQGRYVDVSVLLENGFTLNLLHFYTEFSTDGIKT